MLLRQLIPSLMLFRLLEIKQSIERKSVSCDEQSDVAGSLFLFPALVIVILFLLPPHPPIAVIISCESSSGDYSGHRTRV